jgi:hypothetical protein
MRGEADTHHLWIRISHPDTKILGWGLACVLAGVVGGGVEFADVKVPVFHDWTAQVAFLVAGGVLVALSLIAGVGVPRAAAEGLPTLPVAWLGEHGD